MDCSYAHQTVLSGHPEEVLHASLSAMPCRQLLLPLLPLTFPHLPKLLHSMSDPVLPKNTPACQSLLSSKKNKKQAQQYVLDMFDTTEEPNQGFFIWFIPVEFMSDCLWGIQEYFPCFFVLPVLWHWIGLRGSRYMCHIRPYIFFCNARHR